MAPIIKRSSAAPFLPEKSHNFSTEIDNRAMNKDNTLLEVFKWEDIPPMLRGIQSSDHLLSLSILITTSFCPSISAPERSLVYWKGASDRHWERLHVRRWDRRRSDTNNAGDEENKLCDRVIVSWSREPNLAEEVAGKNMSVSGKKKVSDGMNTTTLRLAGRHYG